MNSTEIGEHLAEAERHVREGEDILSRQRQILERMLARGEDVTVLMAALQVCEQSQAMHIADRARLQRLLEEQPQ
jgi:hypothetical protein